MFANWKLRIPQFCMDGIIDLGAYQRSPIRLLLVLKETNAFAGDMRQYIRDECDKDKTTPAAARWTKAIFGLGEPSPRMLQWMEMESIGVDERRALLRSVCWVNVKKRSGVSSVGADFEELARLEAELFKSQIGLYLADESLRPHLIVCCGTYSQFHERFQERLSSKPLQTRSGEWYRLLDKSIPVLAYCHPAVRTRANHTTYGILLAASELLGIRVGNSNGV